MTVIPVVVGALGTIPKGLVKGLKNLEISAQVLGIKKTSGDYPDYNITKISQSTEKNLGELKKFAVTHTPVKNSQKSKIITKRNSSYKPMKKE